MKKRISMILVTALLATTVTTTAFAYQPKESDMTLEITGASVLDNTTYKVVTTNDNGVGTHEDNLTSHYIINKDSKVTIKNNYKGVVEYNHNRAPYQRCGLFYYDYVKGADGKYHSDFIPHQLSINGIYESINIKTDLGMMWSKQWAPMDRLSWEAGTVSVPKGSSYTVSLPNEKDHIYMVCGEFNDFLEDARMFKYLWVECRDDVSMPPADTSVTPSKSKQSINQFKDVKETDYYYDAIKWAVENGITSGTSATTFSPNDTCTRAQILTFLWKANGSPYVDGDNPYMNDVYGFHYYYAAAKWSFYNNVLLEGGTFEGDKLCTRASAVEFLYNAAGSPNINPTNKFNDINPNEDYAKAVAWALENGITGGTSETTFSPDTTCTRGQIVSFLYRVYGNK